MAPHPLLVADIRHCGDHPGAWRLPTSPIERLADPSYYLDLAAQLPCGGFDAAFFADPGHDRSSGSILSHPAEPATLAAAIAQTVPDVGVVVTSSTALDSPEHIHDQFATLYAVSGGRAAWNITTTAAPNAGGTLHHSLHRDGENLCRAGDLIEDLLQRWGTRRPLLVTYAGTSCAERTFAARYADVVIGAGPTKRTAKAWRRDLRRRARAVGRDPDSIRFLASIVTTLGPTRAAAAALHAELDSLVTAENARDLLGAFGIELPAGHWDRLVEVTSFDGRRSADGRGPALADLLTGLGAAPTWKTLVSHLAGGRGRLSVTGTGADVAATMNEWVLDEACDGFLVSFAHSPLGTDDFIREVSPLLSARGLGTPSVPRSPRRRVADPIIG